MNEHEVGVFGKGDGTQVHIYEYEQAVEFSRNFIRFFLKNVINVTCVFITYLKVYARIYDVCICGRDQKQFIFEFSGEF